MGEADRRPGAAAWLALAAALLVLFLPVVAGGESFFGRDVTPFFYPMKKYLAEAVAAGRIPLWNPLVAGGEPFFAALQPGVLYPGSLVLLLLPFPHGADWLIILHFAFAGAGWLLLLRRLGHSRPAAVLGALAFVLGGFFVSLGNYLNNLQTVSWLPWLFLAWGAWRRDRELDRLVGFGLACVAAFLGGEPQLLGLALSVVLIHGLVCRDPGDPGVGAQLTGFAAAGCLALLVAGVQLLPFVEFLGQSVRTLPLDVTFAASRSQEPVGLLHLLVPPALGAGAQGFTTEFLLARRVPWLLSLYSGVIVAVFAALGLRQVSRAERIMWLSLGIVGLFLALGAHTPVYRAAFEALPPLRALRYPEKFGLLFAAGWPFLAAAGLDRWRSGAVRDGGIGDGPGDGERRRTARPPGVELPVGTIALAYLAAGLLFALRPGLLARLCPPAGEAGGLACGDPDSATVLYGAVMLFLGALLAGTAVVLFLGRRGALRPAAAAWILAGLAAVDLVAAHRPVNPSVESAVYESRPWAADALAPYLERREEYRFRGTPVSAAMGEAARVTGALDLSNIYLDLQALGPNAGQMFGFPEQGGLQGVELRSVALTHDAAIHDWALDPVRFLRRMNVRFYADPTREAYAMRGLRELAQHPELPIRLWEVPDPLPRAFLAAGWELADGPAPALRRALQPELPPRRVVLESAPAEARRESADPPGRLVAATWTPERVRLITRSAAPAVLVLLDRWYPGWKATVGGEPARLLRANGVFRAVEVPAGEADVEFVFAPASLRAGALLSLVGVGLCAALVVLARRRRAGGRGLADPGPPAAPTDAGSGR